jgi:AcrR family transcriptional regulator
MVFDIQTYVSPVRKVVLDTLNLTFARRNASGRRQRTIAAMVLECAENGYAVAKVANVAKRAQISSASIYRDFGSRDALLLQSLEWVISIFAQNWVLQTPETDPVKRIEALLLSHGEALADPFMGWIFRLYVHIANTSSPELLPLARQARDANVGHWCREIAALEAQGLLVPTDHGLVVAILLGAIERRSIFARLAFGENDDHAPSLTAVAKHAALALFQVFGTSVFWANQPDHSARVWGGRELPDYRHLCAGIKALLDPPSSRLAAYAERVLARDVNRLDAESRKIRIQLAAMLECMDVGYEAASMAGVAARAGVSTATFYNDYTDKDALFIDAMVLQARFRVDYGSLIDTEMDTDQMIACLVFSISNVLADPDFLWFHRVSMASEISNAPELVKSSRDTRAHTEGFWLSYLASLEDSGFLNKSELPLTMNLLLGATQRRSVLSMVFFGADDVEATELSHLAAASTDFVLRLIGNKSAQTLATNLTG